jgi:hypothetical protein
MGLRQGFPLSPLLFLIIVEELRKTILEAKIIGEILRVKVGRDLSLTHLLFLDDVLLFLKGYAREEIKFKEIMDLYNTTTTC